MLLMLLLMMLMLLLMLLLMILSLLCMYNYIGMCKYIKGGAVSRFFVVKKIGWAEVGWLELHSFLVLVKPVF